MCGVVGIISDKPVAARMMDVLAQLEYRGYDSAGIATVHDDAIHRCRATGKLINLRDKLAVSPLDGLVGIGHTRWATHGGVTESNAHPHATARVVVVHNGIIENHQELKTELESLGAVYESDTDTETIAHLLTHLLRGGFTPEEAMRRALQRLRGHYALAVIVKDDPGLILAARQGTPLVLGWGEGEMYLASDGDALVPYTRRLTYLEDGDWTAIRADGAKIFNIHGKEVERPIIISRITPDMIELGNHAHFMHKEMHEQPLVLERTRDIFVHPSARTAQFTLPFALEVPRRILIIGCGTAYYAGCIARYWLERMTGIPVDVEVASEYRTRYAPPSPGTLGIIITQSGETLDTLEALRMLKEKGVKSLAIVNKANSTIAREADHVLLTRAGPEIGVASTKALIAQLGTLFGLAITLAGGDKSSFDALPKLASEALLLEDSLKGLAAELATASSVFYLGRGAMYPLAQEGALKLKEISYIHAEGLPAGELKHGPLAMLEPGMPVVVLAPPGELFPAMVSTVEEVNARGGKVLLVSDEMGIQRLKGKIAWSITMPAMAPALAPLIYAIPLQLLAYHVALTKGTDVDKPRNLAKSVTVA